MEVCQNILVPALDAGTQKNRPYQSDIYTVSFHAIPRQAREQDSFDTFLYLFVAQGLGRFAEDGFDRLPADGQQRNHTQ